MITCPECHRATPASELGDHHLCSPCRKAKLTQNNFAGSKRMTRPYQWVRKIYGWRKFSLTY